MTSVVALIGAGAMGGAIGTRMLETGISVRVFDPDTSKVAAMVDRGATACTSAADAVAPCNCVITSLNSPQIVEAAIFGRAGVAEGARAGSLVIDMSSIDPDATRSLATRAQSRGLRWVDSPLSGGAPKALAGKLTLMLGGDAEDVAEACGILEHLADTITHMGPVGTGQTTKLINQVLCGLGFLAVAEATQLALDAGVDVEKVPFALKGGRADSAILQEYMPRFATRDYRRTGRIDNMVKDLDGARDLARRTQTSMPLTAACAEIHRMMAAAGLGGEDQAALMEFFKGPDRERFQ